MIVRDVRLRIVVAWLPAILYTLLIWWLSSQTFEFGLLRRVPLQDKGAHFIEYATLGFFLVHAIGITWPKRGALGFLVAVCMTVALGLLDELHQAFVPGRVSDALDLLADSIGALCAGLLYAGLAWLWRVLMGTRDSADRPV